MTYRYPVDFAEPDHTNPDYHSGNMDVKKSGVMLQQKLTKRICRNANLGGVKKIKIICQRPIMAHEGPLRNKIICPGTVACNAE